MVSRRRGSLHTEDDHGVLAFWCAAYGILSKPTPAKQGREPLPATLGLLGKASGSGVPEAPQ